MIETLMDVYVVTEWRDGCVYETQRVGERWVPLSAAVPGTRLPDGSFLAVRTTLETRIVPSAPAALPRPTALPRPAALPRPSAMELSDTAELARQATRRVFERLAL